MTRNISISSIDKRNLKQILYEKSVFGAAPTHYTLAGDDDWHPIQFVDNKRLQQIQFSDGTTIHVQGETNQTLATLNEIFRERNDANTLDGLEADIESALTDDLTMDAKADDYADDRAHFRGVGGAAHTDHNPDVYDSYSARYQKRELTPAEIDAIARTAPTAFEYPKRESEIKFGENDSVYFEDAPDPVPSADSAETVPTETDPIADFLGGGKPKE